MGTARRLAEEVAKRLNAALPDGVRVEVRPEHTDFSVYGNDGWWGTQGFGFVSGTRSAADLADELETALSGVQDMVVHAVNGAWPGLEDGELPLPWTRIDEDALHCGFGTTLVLPPVPLVVL